jgi:hypothetical protein
MLDQVCVGRAADCFQAERATDRITDARPAPETASQQRDY